MKKDQFINYIKGKETSALLELLNYGLSGSIKTDPDYLQLVLEELDNRQLSESEKNERTRLLDLTFESAKDTLILSESDKGGPSSSGVDLKDYSLLDKLLNIVSFIGVLCIVEGIIGLILLTKNDHFIYGFGIFLFSIILALPYFLIGELGHVLKNTEINTKETNAILKKILNVVGKTHTGDR